MNDFTQQPDASPGDNGQHKKRSAMPVWASIIAIILAILAIIVAAFSYEQYRGLKSDNDTAASVANAQQQTLQSNLHSLQTRLDSTQQAVSDLKHRVGDSKSQAALSQIAYLINVATLQLNVSHNAQTALHLLKTAQSKIEFLNDPRLFALNKAISDDITALRSVPEYNLTKIISGIDALSDDVAASTLMPGPKDLNKAMNQSAHDVSAPDSNTHDKWYQRAWHHISGIKDLIIIRKNDPNVKPLLDAQQRLLIKSAIQSKLVLAETAAIQHNNALFQQHLETVKKWIKKYYYDSVDREHLLAQVNVLQHNNVNPRTPNIDNTITILNQTLNAIADNASSPSDTTLPSSTRPQSRSDKTPQVILPHKGDKQLKKSLPIESDTAGVAI